MHRASALTHGNSQPGTLRWYFFLIQVGKYTVKNIRTGPKQTKQLWVKDVMFFFKYHAGKLRQLPWNILDKILLHSDGLNLKISNQRKSYKNKCIHHEDNSELALCTVRVVTRKIIVIFQYTVFLAWYWTSEGCTPVGDKAVPGGTQAVAG